MSKKLAFKTLTLIVNDRKEAANRGRGNHIEQSTFSDNKVISIAKFLRRKTNFTGGAA